LGLPAGHDVGRTDRAQGLDAGCDLVLRELKVDEHACFPPGERIGGEGKRATVRDAAMTGDYQTVAELRVELDELPARVWVAEYTAVHADLATNPRQRATELKQRARELAAELTRRPAWPSHQPL
jgi:hypothetical protein